MPGKKMYYIGIDLSGPSNPKDTALVVLEWAGRRMVAHRWLLGADDRDIFELAGELGSAGNLVVGIDAPLSYNVGGGDRPSDADLRGRCISAGLRPGSVMAPTMTRMAYLTLRGVAVARLLLTVKEEVAVVEVHPGAAMALRGAPVGDVIAMKRGEESRGRLLEWLERQGLAKIAAVRRPSDHYVAACASALAAWKWHRHASVWLWSAEPPIHPFDYAC